MSDPSNDEIIPSYDLVYNSQGQLDSIIFHLEIRSLATYASPFNPQTKQFEPKTDSDRRIMAMAEQQLDLEGIDFSDKPAPEPEPEPEPEPPPPPRSEQHNYEKLFYGLIDPARAGALYQRIAQTAKAHLGVAVEFQIFSVSLTVTKNLDALMAAFYQLQSELAKAGKPLSSQEQTTWNTLATACGFPELVIPMSSPLPQPSTTSTTTTSAPPKLF